MTIISLVMTRLVFDVVCGANEEGEDLLDQLLGRKRRKRGREEEEINEATSREETQRQSKSLTSSLTK